MKLFSTSNLAIPKILKTITIKELPKIMIVFFLANSLSIFVILET